MSIENGEKQAAAVQKPGTDRVTLESMTKRIAAVEYSRSKVNSVMTICEVRVDNGFVVVGKSAPADPANFDEAFGKKLAWEDCLRQLWPLFGFALCERRMFTKELNAQFGLIEQARELQHGAGEPAKVFMGDPVPDGHPGEYVRKLQQSQAEAVAEKRAQAASWGDKPSDE